MTGHLSGLVVRKPQPHDLDALLACSEAAYLIRYPEAWRERLVRRVEEGAFSCAFYDNELVGLGALYEFALTVPGPSTLRVGGLSEVAVLPTYRRRGVLRRLVGALLEEAKSAELCCVGLFASEGAIYGRFGFGPASFSSRFEIDRTCSELLVEDDAGGNVRLLGALDARECFPGVYDAERAVAVGELDRTDSFWEAVFDEEKAFGTAGGARCYVCYERDTSIDGYAIYEVLTADVAHGRRLEIVELVAVTNEAYRALWRYLLHTDLVSAIVTRERPIDEPLRFLLRDPRALTTVRTADHLWLRVLDVQGALAARRYGFGGALVLEVAGLDRSTAGGRYRLEVADDGTARVESSSEAAELSVELSALGAAYLGGTSFSVLGRSGRAAEHVPGALARASALFSSAEAPFSTADF